MNGQSAPGRRLTVLTRVRCLDCAHVYAKPSNGGTVEENPGCPRCGYVGWIPAAAEFTRASLPPRSDEDQPQRRASRRR